MDFVESETRTAFLSETSKPLAVIRRKIGLLNGFAYVVGLIIGIGIFVSPKDVLVNMGSVGGALLVWISCGVLSTLGAICYSEIASTFPLFGSDFNYIRSFYGELPAFLFIWMNVLIRDPLSKAIQSLTFANYIVAPFLPCGMVSPYTIQIIAAVFLCFMIFLNCQDMKWPSKVQIINTSAKLASLLIIIAGGMYYIINGHTEHFKNAFKETTRNPGNVVFAFYSCLYSYAGWKILLIAMEEVKDPNRKLLKVFYISMPVVCIIYTCTNIAYFAVLSPYEIISSNAVAVTFGDRVLGVMSWIIPVSVAISSVGSLNGSILCGSRYTYAAAREGHLPYILATIHLYSCTPVPSLLLTGLIGLFYLSTTNVYALITYTQFIDAFVSVLTTGGAIWFRYRKPNMERPIKVSIILHVIYFLICLFLATVSIYINFWPSIIGIAITLTGIPVYMVTFRWKNKPKFYTKIVRHITVFLQKVLLCVPAEKGE